MAIVFIVRFIVSNLCFSHTQVSCGENDVISISWRYEEIKEILKRRYSLLVCFLQYLLRFILCAALSDVLSLPSNLVPDVASPLF